MEFLMNTVKLIASTKGGSLSNKAEKISIFIFIS